MTIRPKKNGIGLARLRNAALCSLNGLLFIWQNEEAFRQEMLLFLIGAPLAVFLGDNGCERALLVGSLLLILLMEVVNSAIECVVDRISSEEHALSGAAKDLGSTAVALALCGAGITWILVLWH